MQCSTLSLLSKTDYVITIVKFSSRPIQNLLYFPHRKDLCGLLCGEAIPRSFSASLSWLHNIMINLLTKSTFNISLLFKLKYEAILLLSYIVDCEQVIF